MNWIKYLKIPNFKGIYSRDQYMPKKHSPCILNLDSYENTGTHWVCCAPSQNQIWYFDSFGMGYPEEFTSDGKQIIFNTTQYQNIKSVLCGYYCLFFLHQWALGKDYYDILKPFNFDTRFNEKFIKEYFS